MRISVQMLAFQTETVLPGGMLGACVAQIYPHVDQITIVEGATMARSGHRWDGDATGYTKRREIDKMDKRKQERIDKQRDALGMLKKRK